MYAHVNFHSSAQGSKGLFYQITDRQAVLHTWATLVLFVAHDYVTESSGGRFLTQKVLCSHSA